MPYRPAVGFLIAFLLLGASVARADQEPPPQPELAVGDPAPDFTLKTQDLEDVTLNALRGRPVILAFYVFAFTGG